ncbi:hypothetical protein GC088_07950 [Arthrobacter sp. JZ12]|uniref:ComEA family DNA-binding protein n=1 Tax=Arthrobacter sp. JZ12 TaxID=2654190 RepID=UPI002B487305|nr:ComEA family DNA-binding protein [Arthrobacter sp. JZ12]WRH25010.1 hypothetical protein GC088_07950 [Arthrobacter sp. JZ12]
MARHRWATGDSAPGPDRLERILNGGRDATGKAGGAGDYPAVDYPAEDHTAEDHAADLESVAFSSHGAEGRAAASVRSGRRWAATRRAALVAAGAAVTVGGGLFLGADRGEVAVVPVTTHTAAPHPEPAQDPGEGRPAEAEGAQPARAEAAGTVVVHVAGAVGQPGVVEAPAGSRVFEVLEKAGGALPEAELAAVNLAAEVLDGQQILIPRIGESVQAPDTHGNESSDQGEPSGAAAALNLNTADAGELEELPRVGPVLAQRIVEWREQHGLFSAPEDLDGVPGIGPAMLEALLPLVTV